MAHGRKAKYGSSAFDEAEAIRQLSEFLEKNRSIKTFFKENDRTPNHDGFMELLDDNEEPIKQFIVQIKHVKNLIPNPKGRNEGKYTYPLETNFLDYAKSKVSESPSIYFVVDIVTKNIFWLYLTDDFLGSLGFEGQDTITYHFEDGDIVKDIASFEHQLNQIVEDRNRMFPEMTPDEQDVEILKYFVTCFDRPAFHDDMHFEGCMEDFDTAMEHTLTALNTGVLRSLDGRSVRRFYGKTYVHNSDWKLRLEKIAKTIVTIRRKLKTAKQKNLYVEDKFADTIRYEFHDPKLPGWFNQKRAEILTELSAMCKEVNLPSVEFRCDTYN